MKIYKSEILDGLELQMTSKSAVAECQIIKTSDYTNEVTDDLRKVIAQYSPSNPDQIDLHYLNCVLVSLGWNKNDDVFDKEELWNARSTPEDKPFNYMHDESDIIGHITGSVVFNRDGSEVDAVELDSVPEDFDIITSAVIYKAWSDAEQSIRVKDLISQIENGDWSVSMECLFNNFDYAILQPDGTQKILARTEASAFLTKHLRAYGGDGEYEGYKVGRLLRNISFSGIGLVNKPANPRSVILDNNVDPFFKRGDEMSQETLAKTAASEVEVDFAQKEKELNDVIAALRAEIEAKDSAIAEANTKAVSTQDQLDMLKQQFTNMKRKSALADMGVDPEMIEELLEKFGSTDDNVFEGMVSLLQGMKKSTCEVVAEVEPEVEIELETEVEVVAEVADPVLVPEVEVNEEVNAAKASLSDWLSKRVLKSTKNLKS